MGPLLKLHRFFTCFPNKKNAKTPKKQLPLAPPSNIRATFEVTLLSNSFRRSFSWRICAEHLWSLVMKCMIYEYIWIYMNIYIYMWYNLDEHFRKFHDMFPSCFAYGFHFVHSLLVLSSLFFTVQGDVAFVMEPPRPKAAKTRGPAGVIGPSFSI